MAIVLFIAFRLILVAISIHKRIVQNLPASPASSREGPGLISFLRRIDHLHVEAFFHADSQQDDIYLRTMIDLRCALTPYDPVR